MDWILEANKHIYTDNQPAGCDFCCVIWGNSADIIFYPIGNRRIESRHRRGRWRFTRALVGSAVGRHLHHSCANAILARAGIAFPCLVRCGRHDNQRGDHRPAAVHFEGGGGVEGVVANLF